MSNPSRRLASARSTPGPIAFPLVAAILAVLPLIVSRVDGDADLDPFFVLLVVAALAVAGLLAREPVGRPARLAACAIAVGWLVVAVWAAVLLAMYQTACACSTPDPASLPPVQRLAGVPATVFHVLATYGGGLLVAVAAFGRPWPAAPRET